MVRKSFLMPLLAGAVATIADIKADRHGNAVPGGYIVEFDDSQDTSLFYNHIKSLEGAETLTSFNYTLFKGATVQFQNLKTADKDAAELLTIPSVKQLWPKTRIGSPNVELHWSGRPSEQTQNVKRQITNDTFSPHVQTQVDMLRAKGITGEGVKIAVVDSGIDYTHPALGGCYGRHDCLVIGGYDFVGDDYNGTYNTAPVPDDDPLDQCMGHGTHVAGIIAAQENELGFTGAAPGVKLLAYRVVGCDGDSEDDIIIHGFLRAFEDGAHIITASLGQITEAGWSESALAVTVSRIVENGVPCTVAVGNEGNLGLFTSNPPAVGQKVTAVASFYNSMNPKLVHSFKYSVDGGAQQNSSYTDGAFADCSGVPLNLTLWSPSLNTASRAAAGCGPFPTDTPDLSSRVVLIRQGSCDWRRKVAHAAAAGAKYFIVYDYETDPTDPIEEPSTIDGLVVFVMVTEEMGQKFVRLLAAGSEVTITVADPEMTAKSLSQSPNKDTGGYADETTSWGPSFEGGMGPQLAAPGGLILSTYPLNMGAYAVLSGTSMATPLVAAIYALISNVRGTLDPGLLERVLSATSNPQLLNNGSRTYNMLAPVAQQGAGMVQAYKAAYTTTLLSTSSLAFNDTDNHAEMLNFTISNTGEEEVTYELGSVGAATAYTFSSRIVPDVFEDIEFDDSYAKIGLSESNITLAPGARKIISVTATPPTINATRLPVYSGYVTINGTNGDNLSLPYLGIAGSLHNTPIIDYVYLANMSIGASRLCPGPNTLNNVPIVGDNSTFMIPRGDSNNTSLSTVPFPVMVLDLAFGTPLVHIEAIKVDSSHMTSSNVTGKNLGDIADMPLR